MLNASSVAKYPQGVPFKLYIGNALQMSGVYEGFHVHGAATRIDLKGRDALGGLLRAHAHWLCECRRRPAERSGDFR